MTDFTFPMRINKYLAHMGYATRRSADVLIEKKRVFVNGKPAIIGQKITQTDLVELKDHDTSHYRYILYYKPRGVITHSPEGDEVDIVGKIKQDHNISSVFPIGRLDKDSEGLIILTNDGRVTERLLNPELGHEREYEVSVDKRVTQTFLNHLSKGVNIEGYVTKPAQAEALVGMEKAFKIILTEGKKHQVRRMCAACGYQVKTLKRTRMLSFELKSLKPGGFYELKPKEAHAFQQNLGLH
jgi:23S rRNA pseudouridine2604 synthase